MMARQLKVAGAGPVHHADQRRRPLLPIQTEFHSVVVEPRLVLRIDLASPAVLRGPVDRPEQRPVERPDADALGLEIVFRHPELSPRVDCDSARIVQVLRVVRTRLGNPGDADGPKGLPFGREDLHLMARAPVAHVEVPVRVGRDVLRILEAVHHRFRIRERRPGHGEAPECPPREREEPSFAVERETPRVVDRRRSGDLS